MNDYQFPPSLNHEFQVTNPQNTTSLQSSSSIISSTPSTSSDSSSNNESSSTLSSQSSNKRGIARCNDIPISGLTTSLQTKSPPTKKRKKNGTTHSKLIEEFAQRSHIRNSVNLSSYHGKKQNIKTLCPYHDMLPVINVMEKEVFNNHKENSIKKEYCNILPIIRNHCEWCCSGSPYKLECRNLLMRAKELYEYEFNFNEVALPFMNAVVLGGPNPNICIKLIEHDETKGNSLPNGQFSVTFKPLQNLSLLERNDTCNIALKAISCGTFKRNLQPVPDACRITKLLDGDGCFVTVNSNRTENNHNSNNNNAPNKDIFFKVSTCEVRQRRKLQGTDSVLGVGFDCASRLSWQKPRIYWMHQSIHTLRDKKSKKIIEKKHISNRDLRFSMLVPYDFKGSMIIYMIGIQQDRHYTVNTNVPCKRYGNSGNDGDNINGINGYNAGLTPQHQDTTTIIKPDTSSNNLPPSCFTQDDDLNSHSNTNVNNTANFPPSANIPHPISTNMTQSISTTSQQTDARNSPLSASTTTTNPNNSNVNNGNNNTIPPLPNTTTSTNSLQVPFNNNTNNGQQVQGNNNNMFGLPDSPNGAGSNSSASGGSFPPPPTNANSANGNNFNPQPMFNNEQTVGMNQNDVVMNNKDNNNNGFVNNVPQFGMNMNNMNNMKMNNMNQNGNGLTIIDNNNSYQPVAANGFNGNSIIATTTAPTAYVNTYNPNGMSTMPMQQTTTTTYNIVPMNTLNNNAMNMNNMNNMNGGMYINNNGMNMNNMNMNNMNAMNGMNNMNMNNMNNNGMNMNGMNMMNNTQQQQMTAYGITNNMNNNSMNMNNMNMNNMHNMNNNGMNMNNMNGMNNNNMQQQQQQNIMDDGSVMQGTTYSVISNNNINGNGNNSNNGQFNDNGDKSKYIDDDLENGRKNYLDLLRSVNFRNENYQTCASKWIRTCIERYNQNEDIYHNYLLNIVQSLINSIGDEKTVRGLKRTWMSYNNIENEWSFLHMICSKNLLYLFQSILNLLVNYKHELLLAMTQINKESKLRISPLYCCIINSNHQFTKYLFDYFLNNLQSTDILHILQNGFPNEPSNSLIVHLINYNHTQTLQQLININASRSPQFLTLNQVQLILNKINPQQQQQQNNQQQQQPSNVMINDAFSDNAFSK